ncbi:MAG: hypothetical protein RIQ60_3492 [Pseudomonadota bacterium]
MRLWNHYGQTEIAPLATMLVLADQLRKPVSAGRAVPKVETRVVDDALYDVPAGDIGEVVHSSPHLMQGYFLDDDRAPAAFAGGEDVASREVDEVIYKLPGVSELVVVGLPHACGIEAVTAIIVPKAVVSLTQEQLLAHCAGLLAPIKTSERRAGAGALHAADPPSPHQEPL